MTFSERESLAKEIVMRMGKQSLTQQLLGEKTGLNQSQVSRIIRGDFKRCSKSVLKICKYLRIEIPLSTPDNPRLNAAICRAWDGSKQHEDALIELIDAAARCSNVRRLG